MPDTVDMEKIERRALKQRISELEATIAQLEKLVERTCGDGCHCMEENNEQCALAALLKGQDGG